MNFSPTRRTGAFAILLSFNFAICRAVLTSISTGTESHHSKIASEESKANILGIANEPDRYWTNIHYLDTEPHNLRLDPSSGLYINTIYCWPSMGGIIIAERVLAVELAYIGLDRFHNWRDYQEATKSKMRMMWPDEREVLFLGWPEEGGVWLLRYENWKEVHGDIGTIYNALTMERCEGIKLSGGTFFKDPLESEVVRLLLEGFGEHERKEPEVEDGGWWVVGSWV
ncbi:hypothetical protein IFR04_007162 [Cadophora malorum]|uniref:Uncharacterized protein n=1 Tax=Cadophora malorum TaxID=108018 RepID=A0A8H7THE5_9HELO|nr:hypothetical protein IFR04_007162 [Cadophora malorum]